MILPTRLISLQWINVDLDNPDIHCRWMKSHHLYYTKDKPFFVVVWWRSCWYTLSKLSNGPYKSISRRKRHDCQACFQTWTSKKVRNFTQSPALPRHLWSPHHTILWYTFLRPTKIIVNLTFFFLQINMYPNTKKSNTFGLVLITKMQLKFTINLILNITNDVSPDRGLRSKKNATLKFKAYFWLNG